VVLGEFKKMPCRQRADAVGQGIRLVRVCLKSVVETGAEGPDGRL
jgi:hypothetical protein